MGRYYRDNNGNFEGKFGFAVQNSDAATKFGLGECEPTEVEFYGDDAEKALEGIKKQYDILGVPEEERKYDFTKPRKEKEYDGQSDVMFEQAEITKFVEDIDKKYLWEKVPESERDKHEEIPYSCEEEGFVLYPKSDDKNLASCDLYLGLLIYNTILVDGYCSMMAEI